MNDAMTMAVVLNLSIHCRTYLARALVEDSCALFGSLMMKRKDVEFIKIFMDVMGDIWVVNSLPTL